MSNSNLTTPNLSRRDLLSTAAAATGALVIGFWMPSRADAQATNPEAAAWSNESAADEVNAWVVVNPDETVTVRIGPAPRVRSAGLVHPRLDAPA